MNRTRREFLGTSSLIISGVVLSRVPALGQTQPPAPPVTPTFDLIRGDVGAFTARGGTIGYLINADGVMIVDSQFPDTAQMLLDGLKQRTSRPIDLLINTHHHGDHVGGNKVLRPSVKKIVAHTNVPGLQKAQAERNNNLDDQAYADETFDREWKASIGKETIVATHYGPGHTGGDIVIHFQGADVVHMGDLAFRERHPFVDRQAGASIVNWVTTIESVTKKHGTSAPYIFGHAKDGLPVVCKQADLLAFRDYFSAVLDHVRKGLAASKSKDEVTALKALPGFEGYMEAPPRLTLAAVLGVAYDELTTKS